RQTHQTSFLPSFSHHLQNSKAILIQTLQNASTKPAPRPLNPPHLPHHPRPFTNNNNSASTSPPLLPPRPCRASPSYARLHPLPLPQEPRIPQGATPRPRQPSHHAPPTSCDTNGKSARRANASARPRRATSKTAPAQTHDPAVFPAGVGVGSRAREPRLP
ncbi:hypothetical protein BKA81DRAFT_397433, partial [Phyllosticta paracitricarpa]